MQSTKTAAGDSAPVMAPLAFSVEEFCKQHSISRAGFYILRRQGLGPRVMKVGKRTLIASESAADWRRAMSEAA
jgi:hypothetical protein